MFLSTADETTLDGHDEAIEDQADGRERGEGDEHERGVEEPLVGDVDEHAEADTGAGPLATTAPMTASVTPTRSPPKITGSADGISSSRVRCEARAPRLRSISSSSGSAERIPTMVAMAIGKKTMSAQITTRASRPPPNQMLSNGARTRIGTAWAATMYGDRTRSISTLLPSAMPAITAVVAPAAKPSTTSSSVLAVCSQSTPEAMARAPRSTTTSGAGRMNSG